MGVPLGGAFGWLVFFREAKGHVFSRGAKRKAEVYFWEENNVRFWNGCGVSPAEFGRSVGHAWTYLLCCFLLGDPELHIRLKMTITGGWGISTSPFMATHPSSLSEILDSWRTPTQLFSCLVALFGGSLHYGIRRGGLVAQGGGQLGCLGSLRDLLGPVRLGTP